MEFGLPKCGVLIMKKGKVVKSERKSMPNRKMMKKIEESAQKCLRILEPDGVKHEHMKGKSEESEIY